MLALFSSPRKARQSWAVLVAILLMTGYASVYLIPAVAESEWGNAVSNFLIILAAVLSAAAATMLWAKHDRSDAPRRIWMFYAIGLWLWAMAEISYTVINLRYGNVDKGWPDVFWVSAYLFFVAALLWQLRLLFHFSFRRLWMHVLGTILIFGILLVLLASGLARLAGHPLGVASLLDAFYPLGDLAIGIYVLWIVITFRQGRLARPWFGMFVFAVADLMFALLDAKDSYAFLIDPRNFLSTITDLVYFAAYLIVALGCFSLWLLLIYGPELKE
jgi:hypothetical protein